MGETKGIEEAGKGPGHQPEQQERVPSCRQRLRRRKEDAGRAGGAVTMGQHPSEPLQVYGHAKANN